MQTRPSGHAAINVTDLAVSACTSARWHGHCCEVTFWLYPTSAHLLEKQLALPAFEQEQVINRAADSAYFTSYWGQRLINSPLSSLLFFSHSSMSYVFSYLHHMSHFTWPFIHWFIPHLLLAYCSLCFTTFPPPHCLLISKSPLWGSLSKLPHLLGLLLSPSVLSLCSQRQVHKPAFR